MGRVVGGGLPMAGGAGAVCGIGAALMARSTLAKLLAAPATVVLVGEQLTIDEPGLSYGRRRLVVGSMHMSYAMSDLVGFEVLRTTDHGPMAASLGVRMKNRLENQHLKGRSAEQLRWACAWLSEALARVQTQGDGGGRVEGGAGEKSFVYGEGGCGGN